MCQFCGEVALGAHAVTLTDRPAHGLAGLMWEGTFAKARAGAIRTVIAEVKAFSDTRTTPWKSPIVGLSWNDRADGLRYLVGVALDPGEPIPPEFARVDIPEMRLASSWHGAGDGEVVDHYARMIEWLGMRGLDWDRSRFHHREEYPHDMDLDAPPALRLLLPVSARIGDGLSP